jgi:hypothetical protein
LAKGQLLLDYGWQEANSSLVHLSIFLIDLFVGTYRLSSHARLEAFVIQTKATKLWLAGSQLFC